MTETNDRLTRALIREAGCLAVEKANADERIIELLNHSWSQLERIRQMKAALGRIRMLAEDPIRTQLDMDGCFADILEVCYGQLGVTITKESK